MEKIQEEIEFSSAVDAAFGEEWVDTWDRILCPRCGGMHLDIPSNPLGAVKCSYCKLTRWGGDPHE